MQQMIDSYLNKLVISLFKAIQFIKKNSLTNESNSKIIEELAKTYASLTNGNFDVLHYNFSTIKRNANRVLHPDLIDGEIKASAEKITSELNGVLNDIQKAQKSMQGMSSYFWTYTPSQKNSSNQNNNYSQSTRNQSSYNQKNTGPTYQYNPTDGMADFPETYKTTFKELWDYFVHKIPRDIQDYLTIKAEYEKLINRLQLKIKNKEKVLGELKSEITKFYNIWSKKISQRNVEIAYNEELQKLSEKLTKLLADINNIVDFLDARRENVLRRSQPEIDRRIKAENVRLINLSKVYDGLKNLDPSFAKAKYPGSKQTYEQVKLSIEAELKKYSDFQAIILEITDEFVARDKTYMKHFEKYNLMVEEARNLQQQIVFYQQNPNQVMHDIVEQTNSEYRPRYNNLSIKIKLIESKNSKLKKRLDKINKKYNEFLQSYQEYYEPKSEKRKRK